MNACGCQFCKTKNFAFPLLQRCWNFLFEARIRERIIVCMKGFLSVFFLALHCLFAGEQVFKISEFGAFPGKGDASGAVAAALKAAAACGGPARISFEKGTYHFGCAGAHERYLFVSNNDSGLKAVVFLIEKADSITIDGGGASFVFHGNVSPFAAINSRNVKFENFSVDVSRPLVSEGKILEADSGGIVVEFPENFPYCVSRGTLQFRGVDGDPIALYDDFKSVYPYRFMLEFDPATGAFARMARDYPTLGELPAKQLDGRKVRIFYDGIKAKPGNIMAFWGGHRKYPSFTISNCSDLRFDNITIHSSLGMGIIAQNSGNVEISNCKVTPSKGRYISCAADATHFVNCSGKIILRNNLFERQLDDATNIHGIYEQIADISGGRVLTRLVHRQQRGFETFVSGGEVEFVKASSMICAGHAKVASLERVNSRYKVLEFDSPLPPSVKVGDCISRVRDYPQVVISGNIIRGNRARGILLNCRGKTLVENNIFSSPGTAILFEGDASFWFEQGGIRDCLIKNNTFDSCKYGVWGRGIIAVGSGIRADMDKSRYHKNLRIEGNTFRVFDKTPLLYAYCLDGLKWRGNKVEKSDSYPESCKDGRPFIIKYCDNIDIDTENSF